MDVVQLRNGQRVDPREFPPRIIQNVNDRMNAIAAEQDVEPSEATA